MRMKNEKKKIEKEKKNPKFFEKKILYDNLKK